MRPLARQPPGCAGLLGDGQGDQVLSCLGSSGPAAWEVESHVCSGIDFGQAGHAPLSSQRPPSLPVSPSGLAVLEIPLLEMFLQVTAWVLKGPCKRHVSPEMVTH